MRIAFHLTKKVETTITARRNVKNAALWPVAAARLVSGVVEKLPIVAVLGTVLLTAGAAAGAPLEDFWSGRATFEFVRMWRSPSDDNPAYDNVFYNQQAYIVPARNLWYSFSREAISPKSGDADAVRPSYCKGDYARIVLHTSTDQGATWTDRTVLVEPTPGTPWECAALDGTAFFDASMATWHLVFQCAARDGHWEICHATRRSADPAGPFTIDPRASVTGSSIVKKMGLPRFFDEGTPQIVAKRRDRFYMTFHAYNGVQGIRGMAWTRDFHRWFVDGKKPLFDSNSCAGWNVPWSGGCVGGGWADVLHTGSFYYMIVEAADKNMGGGCTPGKHWVIGLLRTGSLRKPTWQSLPGGPGIIFNPPLLSAGRHPCGANYAQLFRSNGDTYLSVFLTPVPSSPEEPATGRYLYELRNGAPVASYRFSRGIPGQNYALSDVISRGDLYARIENLQWLNPGLQMNGVNSEIILPDNLILKRSPPWSLEVDLTLRALPIAPSKSAFIAGDLSSSWLELYSNQTICAWARTAPTPQKACAPLPLNTPEDVAMVAAPNSISLFIKGKPTVTQLAQPIRAITRLTVGSAGQDRNGFYGSWNGVLSRVSLFDYPLHR